MQEELIKHLEAGETDKIPDEVMDHIKSSCHRVEVGDDGVAKAAQELPPPECPERHQCDFKRVLNSKSYPGGEWICDDCDKNFVLGQRWACSKCEYDMCTECGKNASTSQLKAEKENVAKGACTPGATKLVRKPLAFDVNSWKSF